MSLDKYNTALHYKNTHDEKFLRMMIVLKRTTIHFEISRFAFQVALTENRDAYS